ncbi:hypothetical protein ACJX0J_039390, partial [Zea mays]
KHISSVRSTNLFHTRNSEEISEKKEQDEIFGTFIVSLGRFIVSLGRLLGNVVGVVVSSLQDAVKRTKLTSPFVIGGLGIFRTFQFMWFNEKRRVLIVVHNTCADWNCYFKERACVVVELKTSNLIMLVHKVSKALPIGFALDFQFSFGYKGGCGYVSVVVLSIKVANLVSFPIGLPSRTLGPHVSCDSAMFFRSQSQLYMIIDREYALLVNIIYYTQHLCIEIGLLGHHSLAYVKRMLSNIEGHLAYCLAYARGHYYCKCDIIVLHISIYLLKNPSFPKLLNSLSNCSAFIHNFQDLIPILFLCFLLLHLDSLFFLMQ